MKELLKSGDILLFKGGKWNKLLKGLFNKETRNWYFSRIFIQLFTLSRAVHTATYIKEGNKHFIVQSLFHEGVCKKEVDPNWILSKIKTKEIIICRQERFNKQRFDTRLKVCLGLKYSLLGIYRIGFFNIFGTKTSDSKGMFCSELTAHLHDLYSEPHLVSPADIETIFE
jgi:hypothetical protein